MATVEQTTDVVTVATGTGRGITIQPTFQRGFIPNIIDGFRFTVTVTGAVGMPTKIFRYRLVPSMVQATASEPPTVVELKGAFDGVCSPADLEDFPEDWPAQNARPPWYRLDFVDVILRSRSIAEEAYQAILFEIERLIDTLDTMDQQDVMPPVIVGVPPLTMPTIAHTADSLLHVGPLGVLDTTFGTNGWNYMSPGNASVIYSIAQQDDGKIVAAGVTGLGTNPGLVLARYNTNGSLDTSFGTNGWNLTQPGTNSSAFTVAIQSDGKILVGGQSRTTGGYGFALGMYNTNGSIDINFGINGWSLNTPGTADRINALAIQPDGKILAVGAARSGSFTGFAAARYNVDGSLDTSFGTNGWNINTPATNDMLNALAIQPDGKIVAGGKATLSGASAYALTRYNTNGTRDATFGSNGFQLTTPGVALGITGLALLPNGQILAGGTVTPIGGSTKFCPGRYNADGSVDRSFGTNGFMSTPNTNIGSCIVLLRDGGFLIGGSAGSGGLTPFTLVRYTPSGAIDTHFGTNGYSSVLSGMPSAAMCALLQPDGKVVAAGSATVTGTSAFAITRYN